jgi:Skp family chaperone for outer membrane proteins
MSYQKWINGILALAVAAALALSLINRKVKSTIAFMDTSRVLTGFKEAHKVNDLLKVEDEKWRKNLKILEDSLKVFMDSMTVRYDNAPIDKKRQMQDELAERNQRINNFSAANTRRLQEMQEKNMKSVYDRINSFLKEYGKKHGYQIIFGTTNGSIVYGEGTALDITNEIIEQLNARYQ